LSADAVFAALADPTRRQVVERLAGGGTATATGLARELPVSRQAIAKHLASLRAAHLVSSMRVGRETRYRLEPRHLADAAGWIARVGGEWDERLGELERVLKARSSARSRRA
jgi:DNA-binding transcriptional ArsR family regulator